jgi:hypothetical protein
MTCEQTRNALFVADLSEPADGELATHLEQCADCHALLASLRGQTASLGVTVRRRRSRRLAFVIATPIAAAALATIALGASHDRSGMPPALARSSSPLPVARRVSLTVAPGQSAAVLRTADTTVTVIWFTGAGQ